MASYKHTFQQMLRRMSPSLRDRGRVVRKLSDTLGFVYFGQVDQHEDDHSAIRGFTASLTHTDTHYTVGTYEGHDIRIVDRLDILNTHGHTNHQQVWTILEIDMKIRDMPHVFFVPTGQAGPEYARLFTTQPHLQPLNSYLTNLHHSPEFHGRYQILARAAHSHEIERLFQPHLVAGIGTRFWPQGIEFQHGKLYIYLTDTKLTMAALQTALTSAIWLADHINETASELQ